MNTETQTQLTDGDVRAAWFAVSAQQDAAVNETPVKDWLWELADSDNRRYAEILLSYERGVALLKNYRLIRKYVGTVPYHVSETGSLIVESLSDDSPTVVLPAGYVATSQSYTLAALRKTQQGD